jgi:hypothetical protein
VAREDIRGRPQGPLRIEDVAGNTLKQVRLVRLDAEMMQLHPRLGPRQGGRAVEGRGVVILVGERDRLVTRGRHDRGEQDADGLERTDPHAAPKTDDRVEHRADGVRQRAAVEHGPRGRDVATSTDEARPVGLPLQRADGLALDARHVGEPHRRLVRRARTPGGEERVQLGDGIRLNEQV